MQLIVLIFITKLILLTAYKRQQNIKGSKTKDGQYRSKMANVAINMKRPFLFLISLKGNWKTSSGCDRVNVQKTIIKLK